MGDNSTAISSVIPFDFRGHSVRAVSINGEPWFVAADVCRVLDVTNTTQAMQALDEDERSMFNIGRQGQVNIVNDSGLYTLILRCRDAVKKGSKPHAFRKWVTAEVLPAIRKHGHYEDKQSKMPTLMDELIGMGELSVIKGLIRDKSKAVPAAKRQSFALTMHNRLHTRFNVPRTELIPAGQFEAACNFIAAYSVLEGEFIAKEQTRLQLPLNINYPIEAITCRRPDMLIDRGEGHAWLDVSLDDLRENFTSPCEMILSELTRAGYEVEGAWWELRTYRNKIYSFMSFAQGISRVAEDPKRYAIKMRAAA
ncbi:Bro-N domain-containing protein [Pseudomonas guariconensis]|nr:Bro-N domain-containing protein [Pseudomonas guariconensis]MCO7634144.1 Bro-N domain-containing protein [Pseudomonas guariconensis]